MICFAKRLKSSTVLRYKCTVAVPQYDDNEMFAVKSKGHAAAAMTKVDKPLNETWKINPGRGNFHQWLSGTHSEDWFTTRHWSCCPDEFC